MAMSAAGQTRNVAAPLYLSPRTGSVLASLMRMSFVAPPNQGRTYVMHRAA
jgi:hypothetical protein